MFIFCSSSFSSCLTSQTGDRGEEVQNRLAVGVDGLMPYRRSVYPWGTRFSSSSSGYPGLALRTPLLIKIRYNFINKHCYNKNGNSAHP